MAFNYPTSTAALVLSGKLDLSAAGPFRRDLQSMPGMPSLIDVTKGAADDAGAALPAAPDKLGLS